MIEDSVQRLNIKREDKVSEIGQKWPSINRNFKKPKQIKVIEISPIFRNHLKKNLQ